MAVVTAAGRRLRLLSTRVTKVDDLNDGPNVTLLVPSAWTEFFVV
jgi:hypothetical protein